MRMKKIVIGLVCVVAVATAAPARSAGLEYSLTPYVWATGFDGTVGLGAVIADVDVGFGDIFDNLEMAIPVHFEAKGPVWTLIAEVNYASVSQDMASVSGTADFDYLIGELLSGWQFRPSFELIFGARYVEMDTMLSFDAPPTGGTVTVYDSSQKWVDPVVGIRYGGQLNRRGTWHSYFRADAAGFGMGSDLTWNVRLNFGVDLSYVTSLWFGYHWMDTDYEDKGFLFDMLQQGPEIGLRFKF